VVVGVLSGRPCPYCHGHDWAGPLGGGGLKPGILVLTALDEIGERSSEGLEVVAFTCRECGYLRFHNHEMPGRSAPPDLDERIHELAERAAHEK
jgi:hypothetical protein